MATITSSAPVRAVIIDGPETGQIITLNGAASASPETAPSAAVLVDRIEGRVNRINLKVQEMLTELRSVNAQFKDSGS